MIDVRKRMTRIILISPLWVTLMDTQGSFLTYPLTVKCNSSLQTIIDYKSDDLSFSNTRTKMTKKQ